MSVCACLRLRVSGEGVCASVRRATIPGESNGLPATPDTYGHRMAPRSRLLEDPTRGTWPEAGNEEQSQLVEHDPSLTLSRATRCCVCIADRSRREQSALGYPRIRSSLEITTVNFVAGS